MAISKYIQRDDGIAIAKAIGIILVVVGHCSINNNRNGILAGIHDFIYLFHMPLFFFLSGYFFRWDILEDKKRFVEKKIKGLWMPYVKWMLLFLILHNYLFDIGMLYPYDGVNPVRFDFARICSGVLNILLLNWNEPLLGGFWFIPALFFSSIFSMLALYFVNLIIPQIERRGQILVVIVLFIIAACVLAEFHKSVRIIGIRDRVFLASAIFLSGFYVHSLEGKFRLKQKKLYIFIILTTLVLIACSRCYAVEIIRMRHWYDVPYLWLTGIIGSIGIIVLSRLIVNCKSINKRLIDFIIYIGENTLIILALHFSCFKLINLLKVHYYGMDDSLYGCFPILCDDPSQNGLVWWLLYILIGVLIPISIKKISGCLFKALQKTK